VTKYIPLSRGLAAIVDDADFDFLSQWKWCALRPRPTVYYAVRQDYGGEKPVLIYMHRLLTEAPRGMEVDHRNHNGLDNRRENLRVCTRRQNSQNQRVRRSATSPYKGVTRSSSQTWAAKITFAGKQRRIGTFATEEEAALAYNRAAIEHFGEFARLNRVEMHATTTTTTHAQGVTTTGGNDGHTTGTGAAVGCVRTAGLSGGDGTRRVGADRALLGADSAGGLRGGREDSGVAAG
jgi:hypothetical protein